MKHKSQKNKIQNQNEKYKNGKYQNWGSGHPLWPPAATTQKKCEKCRTIAQSASQKRDLDERILVAPEFLKIDEF